MKRKSRSATGASVGQWCNQRNKFGIADRSCLLQSIELLDFIGSAETNHASEFIARATSSAGAPSRYFVFIVCQICKHTNGSGYLLALLLICSDVMTFPWIVVPYDFSGARYVHQEISIGEAFLREEHCDSPFGSLRPSTEISTMTIAM